MLRIYIISRHYFTMFRRSCIIICSPSFLSYVKYMFDQIYGKCEVNPTLDLSIPRAGSTPKCIVWACDSSVTATCMPDRLLHVVSITHRPTSTAESSTRLSYRGTTWLEVAMLYNCDSKSFFLKITSCIENKPLKRHIMLYVFSIISVICFYRIYSCWGL